MSIKVINLTKQYGAQRAVDNISFSVGKGEITGFLGPNGAGKSTTMKILAGYLPPTAGIAEVEGMDVSEHPLQVKQSIGYLPEHNPLYPDMYVHEYLEFMAGICKVKNKNAVGSMVEMCGLSSEQGKQIGMLSRGFRQRVGLAQALIHNPPVLVLDEPTAGLDPNQLLEIRKLIKTMSSEKTVLFSSHILQEVQALCDRVIVIHEGKIVADDRIENLTRTEPVIVVEFASETPAQLLREMDGVDQVTELNKHRFRIRSRSGVDIRPALTRLAAERNLGLVELKMDENSLESVFGKLTGQKP